LNFIRDTVEENAARVEELIVDLTQKGEFQERKDSEG
jgi:hypothetical protein